MVAVISGDEVTRSVGGHAIWVRITHWILAASVLTLAFTGVVILMAHPRLYWGNAGNDLTPALLELPISRNYKHGGWVPESTSATPVVSAVRTYDIFNENGWARSLHFLAAWFLCVTGLIYLITGLVSGHLWRDLTPRLGDLAPRALWRDFVHHLRLPLPRAPGGPPYGRLQKISYAGVVFIALPLMVLTGLTMAPAVAVLFVFLIVHLAMVLLTGVRRQLRAMTFGD